MPLGVVILDDEQVAHRAIEERRGRRECSRELLGVGRAPEEAGRAGAERRVALARLGDDVHGHVARARVMLELVEDAGAAAIGMRQHDDVGDEVVREREADVAARRDDAAEAVLTRLHERARAPSRGRRRRSARRGRRR